MAGASTISTTASQFWTNSKQQTTPQIVGSLTDSLTPSETAANGKELHC